MTTTYYASVNDCDGLSVEVASAGTSSTAAYLVELRMGEGSIVPTQRQVLNALEVFKRHIMSNGVLGSGTNLPENRG